jgi:hypothetical protein
VDLRYTGALSVAKHVLDKPWLDALVAGVLARHDPAEALARMPADVRQAAEPNDLAPAARLLVARSLRRLDAAHAAPVESFLDQVRRHVELALDLAALQGTSFDVARGRAEIAAFLAAALGEDEHAADAYAPSAPPRAAARAIRVAEATLRAQLYPPGDPFRGLPLHPGLVAIQRRRLARIVMGHHRHRRLDPAALARHAAYAHAEAVLLVETLAGLLEAAAPADDLARTVRARQLARLGLPRAVLKEARRALAPRAPELVARAAPERVRPFLVEQLFLAVLRAGLEGPAVARHVEAFVAATGLDAAAVAAAQVEAAAQHGEHHVWFEALDDGGPSWSAFAQEWDEAADQIVERVSSAVTDNLEAMVTEIRETGELGALLAKATAGGTLTAEEKRKIRAQLVDLAKAVPALAIFAAPGGMLLLPLLAKLLPFSIVPSAWEKKPGAKGAAKKAAAKTPADGEEPAEAKPPGKARSAG